MQVRPGGTQDAIVVHICECGYRVVRVSEVPHIDLRLLIIISSHQELSRNFRIPDQSCFLILNRLSRVLVVEVVFFLRNSRLSEVEDSL